MVDTLSREERSERMALIAGKDTGPEMVVRRLIHGLGFRYRLHGKGLPGKPDLVFARRRKVIFVHGCFWHRHAAANCTLARMPKSRLAFWKPKLEKNRIRDMQVRSRLTKLGWQSLTIWECELKNMDSIARRVRKFLDE